jgi:aminoglycoside 6'-N-acetyltransferase
MTSREIAGERVVLAPLRPEHIPRLCEIAAEPEVARWWGRLDADDLAAEAAQGRAFAIVYGEEVVGLAQFSEEEEPEFRHAGIDVFLTARLHGRGLGTDAVRTLARHLVRDRGHHRITIDPSLANERAIRCYRRVGFKPVGVLRRYWRDPNGVWQDGLLLDLLAEELDEESDASA